MTRVNVIGGGLAGCEACYQLLKRGYDVYLFEMKPKKFTPAHVNKNLCELVCSNSLKSNDITNACGLLKEEMRRLDSLLIRCADLCRVPAGSALAVDREKFSEMVTHELSKFPNLHIINEEVKTIDQSVPTIIATGPLTSDDLSKSICSLIGQEYFYFFDAIAPIVTFDSLDMEHCYIADRYDKGDGDYLNCPLTKEEYLTFVNELEKAKTVELKDFENTKVFEGCMPVEVLCKRGIDALRYGPMKPVGLTNPKTGKWDYAVLQLRKEHKEDDMYNLVGFQTNLLWGEQKRVFSLIPALKNAEYVRYGVMHRNSFVNAPQCINKFYQLQNNNNIFIAGQLSGVEGYIESMSSGMLCAINMDRLIRGVELIDFGMDTMIGALPNYISSANVKHFQPMNSNFGIIAPLGERIRDKKEKYLKYAQISLKKIDEMKSMYNL